MLRVLHVNAGNLYGGIESTLATIAATQHHDPFTGVIHEFALCFDGRLADELADLGAPAQRIGEVRARQPWSVRRARGTLERMVQKRNIDVVITHNTWSHAVFGPAAMGPRRRVVLWLHNEIGRSAWDENMARRVAADAVIVSSAYIAARVPPRLASQPIVVRYPVRPLPRIDLLERARVRAELSTGSDDVVVVQVSRMQAWKGQRNLVQAVAMLGLERPQPLTVWLVGGAQRDSEQAYVRNLACEIADLGLSERVRVVGERRDVGRLLGAADVFCQANERPEPFGIVFVDALSAGLPAVGLDMGGTPEIIDDTCGRIIPPHDIEALAGALAELVGDAALRTRLGATGPARAAMLCDPARQVARLNTVLGDVFATAATRVRR